MIDLPSLGVPFIIANDRLPTITQIINTWRGAMKVACPDMSGAVSCNACFDPMR